ncbi:MAG: hypothetical protein HKN77_04655, partial [Woeseiaceae bacterium]|nr:hypothetical protein [Woeseiaceae bacterium]
MIPTRITILVIVSTLLPILGCSQKADAPEKTAAPGDAQAELVARAGAPLFDGMG